ncbi:porin [Aquabacterium sp.]|uniref:porin n=1 Tax=Aquabacterium sp. TaxID=1872578 RepID=UPI0035B373DF
MQKTALTKAVAIALATMGAGAAFAQSSVTVYGNLDVAVDSATKGAGKITGTVWERNPTAKANVAAESHILRVAPSVSSSSALGVKGTEDLGAGYKAGFVLEGQMGLDTGAQNGQDSRMWGRQAFVGLTTPMGEVRLGRQYAPMFYSFAFSTVEALGGADLQAFGLVTNSLQIRQDNQISYWLKTGGLTASIAYSPQAGVSKYVSSVRAPETNGDSTGQILGGASAGTEAAGTDKRGQSFGLFANYAVSDAFMVNAAYHMNHFGDAVAISYNKDASGSSLDPKVTPLFNLDKHSSYSIGAKYTVPEMGTQISGIFHAGKYEMDAGSPVQNIKTNTFALGVKHPIGNFAVGAQYAVSKFTNFSEGKDTALMLIGDYNFSKRTKLYARFGFAKDDAGKEANTGNSTLTNFGLGVNGGPLPALTGLGSQETPFFSGAGANVGNTTRMLAIGVRHQF